MSGATQLSCHICHQTVIKDWTFSNRDWRSKVRLIPIPGIWNIKQTLFLYFQLLDQFMIKSLWTADNQVIKNKNRNAFYEREFDYYDAFCESRIFMIKGLKELIQVNWGINLSLSLFFFFPFFLLHNYSLKIKHIFTFCLICFSTSEQ